jgi:hypothetical protein
VVAVVQEALLRLRPQLSLVSMCKEEQQQQ